MIIYDNVLLILPFFLSVTNINNFILNISHTRTRKKKFFCFKCLHFFFHYLLYFLTFSIFYFLFACYNISF
ncbi:hypothetical protein H8356DRAFT_1670447 [Neocallimastix lanati (nom. inval.)]|nr:hypothetical protein H8356DRAFT_1670447 [Neocallimastix sp. JGI-2020a]